MFLPCHNIFTYVFTKIYEPIVSNLKLQIRMNPRTKHVEMRVCPSPLLSIIHAFYLFSHSSLSCTYIHLFIYTFSFQTTNQTEEISALTKATDFVKAYIMGFEVNVCIKPLPLSPSPSLLSPITLCLSLLLKGFCEVYVCLTPFLPIFLKSF